MKRIHAVLAVLALTVVGAVAYAAPDVDPVRSQYQQFQNKVPQHFEKDLNAAFVDAGVVRAIAGNITAATASAVDAGAVRVAGTLVPISSQQDGGSGQMRLLSGYCVLSSNDCAITFNPAFAAIPDCTCSAVNATAAACGVKAIPSASAVTFRGANASDAIYWSCHGAK